MRKTPAANPAGRNGESYERCDRRRKRTDGRQYEDICKEHGCKAKVFTKESGS